MEPYLVFIYDQADRTITEQFVRARDSDRAAVQAVHLRKKENGMARVEGDGGFTVAAVYSHDELLILLNRFQACS